MTRAIGRAIAAGGLGALLSAAWLAGFYMLDPTLRIEFDTDLPRAIVSGVHPPERDQASGLTFAWTQQEMTLRLPGLDRSVDWTLDLRVRAARPDASRNPDLLFSVDGVLLLTRASTTDFETVRVTIPARPERRRGARISIRSSNTFVPGPGDTRALGVLVDSLALSPASAALPPPQAFAGAAVAAAALGVAVALLGVTPAAAIGAAALLSAGAASQIARGFAPHTDYPMAAAAAALWIGLTLVVLARAAERVGKQPLRNTARFVAAFSAGALFLKLLIVLHPNMPIGDAMFHAHRFQGVLAGNLYFTSVAPGNYSFPYAPGLYVFSAAFAWLVTRGPDDMALLRTIVLCVDAAAALLLYRMVVQGWSNRVAGAVAVALYHLIPLDFYVVSTANLTNAFAQSLAVVAFALLASPAVGRGRIAANTALAVALTAAFLSHTSTFPLLFTSCVVVAVLLAWRAAPEDRSTARAILVAAVSATVIAVVVYYGHFLDTYRTEFARIGGETATGAADAGGRGIGDRLSAVPFYLRLNFGAPVLILTAIGGWRLWQSAARDRLTLAVAGWAIACLAFLAVGILTPVDMRYYLASIPAFALTGARGTAYLWQAGAAGRRAAVLLLAWAIWVGADVWWTTS